MSSSSATKLTIINKWAFPLYEGTLELAQGDQVNFDSNIAPFMSGEVSVDAEAGVTASMGKARWKTMAFENPCEVSVEFLCDGTAEDVLTPSSTDPRIKFGVEPSKFTELHPLVGK
ncbi:hypothetical protein AbraIFM66951_004133 [Aspergillus brasiliensis]|nr:hypothetical protein AbraIFM66951_004133 [Aspergillus brasiliensis]